MQGQEGNPPSNRNSLSLADLCNAEIACKSFGYVPTTLFAIDSAGNEEKNQAEAKKRDDAIGVQLQDGGARFYTAITGVARHSSVEVGTSELPIKIHRHHTHAYRFWSKDHRIRPIPALVIDFWIGKEDTISELRLYESVVQVKPESYDVEVPELMSASREFLGIDSQHNLVAFLMNTYNATIARFAAEKEIPIPYLDTDEKGKQRLSRDPAFYSKLGIAPYGRATSPLLKSLDLLTSKQLWSYLYGGQQTITKQNMGKIINLYNRNRQSKLAA